MANKKNKIKEVKDVELDELVNEGKNVDTVKVSEIIAEHTEEPTTENEVTEDTEVEVTDNTTIDDSEEVTEDVTESEVSSEDSESTEETDNIDDVISECTGVVEPKEEPKPTKVEKEPWYVSRAKRVSDYYNW